MKRRILSFLCALSVLLSLAVVPAYAADGVSLQDTINVYDSGVIKLEEDASDITVTKDVIIDLNGYSINGVTVTGGTLYVMDSQTADFTVADGNFGKVTNVTGNVAAAEGYLSVDWGNSLSFHRVDLEIKSMSLRPGNAGVYYTSNFAGDEVVSEQVFSYGIALSVAGEPTAENLDKRCAYSVIEGFEPGTNAANGTLLVDVMSENNTDGDNRRFASMPVYGRAYIKTLDGYVFGPCVSRDFRSLVESVDGIFGALNTTQKAGILELYNTYAAVMESWNVPNIRGCLMGDIVITVPVQTENGVVTETVTVEKDGMSITVPFGTLVEKSELTLKVTKKEQSDSGIEAEDDQTLMPFDVHVDGVSSENTQPITVELGKVMPENLNMGNYTVYHVEESGTNAMELVAVGEEFTAHNQYKYTLDGELTLHMATFSEVAVVSENENGWKNGVDHSWYDADKTELEIRNADQLWSFSQIVGGMAKDNEGNAIAQDSFSGKTVKLLADIDLADGEAENDSTKIFYPIGYYNNTGSYVKQSGNVGPEGAAVASGYKSFCGIFDGNGNTISDFYQNTWEMFGDYNDGYSGTPNHSRDGMGLFGRIYGGTVKNLTVDNFQSDGEFATTGTIAAYADCGAVFTNIAIFNCNPRVYNIGNGGIVGCVGWYAKDVVEDPVTFTNITVDKSNKISALWGSWDVACGGLVGQYYPTSGQSSADYPKNAGVSFDNCHVAAQIDVYNDVCANYQYYAYRYAGMIIGSIRENETIDGYVYPKMDGITATGCTVEFDSWNDYYYCELVANSLASYTHDHQFSRLEQVASVDVEKKQIVTLEGETVDIPASGRVNYVVVLQKDANDKWIHGDGDEYAECYHFVDGDVWNHEDADYEEVDTNGDGVKETVLKEDKQHIYREFKQLFTGYGWGVTSKGLESFGEEDNIKVTHRDDGTSFEKFVPADGVGDITNYTAITIGELFTAAEQTQVPIVSGNVQVTVSPADPTDPANSVAGVYTPNAADWTLGTLELTGVGEAKITITDYYFCTPTTITVTIKDREPEIKFDKLFNKDFLYRVGNQNTVAVGKIFADAGVAEIGTVSVTVEPVTDGVSGTYTPNETWTNGTLTFTGTGVVKVTITDNDYCTPTELYLEVVDAKNVTAAESATANNVVLLNNTSGGFSVSGEYGFYGNGFTVTLNPNNHSTKKGNGYAGYIHMNGGTIDNVRIEGPVFAESNIYQSQGMPSGTTTSDTTVNYFRNAINIDGGNAKISNSYISGARTAVCVKAGGNVVIENSRISGGAYANIEVLAANSLTLCDVTTEQKEAEDSYGQSKAVIGTGVVINNADTKLILDGVKQYNWLTQTQWESMLGDYKSSFPALFSSNYQKIQYSNGGNTYVNTGIIWACEVTDPNIEGAIDGYAVTPVSIGTTSGAVYTSTKQSGDSGELSDADINAEAYKANTQGAVPPATSFDYTSKNNEPEQSNSNDYCYYNADSGKFMISFDVGESKNWYYDILTVKKGTTTLPYTVSVTGSAVVNSDNTVTFKDAGDYTVTYTYEDAGNYKLSNGEVVSYYETYTQYVYVTVFAVEPESDPTTFAFGSNGYKSASAGGLTYVMPNVTATKDPTKSDNVVTASGIGSKDIDGETIYYPIIGMHKVGSTFTGYYNYFSIFEAVTINDANGTDSYSVATTAVPSGLQVIGGFILDANGNVSTAESANGTAIFNYSTGKTIKTKSVTVKGTSVGLCYYPDSSFSSGTTARAEQTIVVKYCYTDTNGKLYYYYIGYWCAQGNNGVQSSSGGGCVAADTLITMSDGSVKRIDEITYNDEFLVWNYVTGTYDVAPASIIFYHGYDTFKILNLYFEDGTELRVINDHGLFNVEQNNYVYVDFENVDSFVDTHFVKADADGIKPVKLVGYAITEEYTGSYCLQTAVCNNYIANGMFSLTKPEFEGWFDYFEIGEGMKYDEEKMQADIEKYGLYTYEDFAEYVTYEQFLAFNGPYLKVLVGRGVLTYEDILYLIATYVN